MENKKVYLVIHSMGSYEDYREQINETCFSTLSAAEKCKEDIEEYYKSETPFPFDWCDEYQYEDLIDEGKVNNDDKDYEIYNKWWWEKSEKQDYNSCWIKELKLE